jgi:hypothetical protein
MEVMFEEGKTYSRVEIQRALGGSLDDYLPHQDDRVVCGCFKVSANPSAPRVILIDNKPDILHWADVLCEQQYPIPVFVKKGKGWEYKGKYQVRSWYDDFSHIGEQEELTGRRNLGRIIVMRRAETS